jgi:hypothetical protein
MNTFAAFVRAGSVRFFRPHPGHSNKGRRAFQPHLEDLESRVVPSGCGAPHSHLSNTALVCSPGNDQLDAFWSGPGTGTTQDCGTQPPPGASAGQISAFNKLNVHAALHAVRLEPVVTVTNPDPFASEDPSFPPGTPETEDTATFRIMRSSGAEQISGGGDGSGISRLAPLVDDSQPLTVFFTIGGTAQNGVDYVFLESSVTIPAGQDFVDITVIPFPRPPMVPIPLVSVTLTLEPSDNYTIGQQNNALIVIFEGATFPHSGGSGGMPTPPPVIPPVTPPPVTPTPTLNTINQLSIAMGNQVKPQLSPSVGTPELVELAGLPLDPALRDRPGGLPPARGDQIGLVGGTSAVGQISGKIFDDFNGSGIADGFKPGIAGVTVFLDLNNNGVIDHGEPTTTTNANGEYAFTGLQAGSYVVRQAMPGNFLQTLPANEAPYQVSLQRTIETPVTDRNFGIQLLSNRGRAVGTPGRQIPTIPVPAKPTRPPSPGGGGADGPDDEDGSD